MVFFVFIKKIPLFCFKLKEMYKTDLKIKKTLKKIAFISIKNIINSLEINIPFINFKLKQKSLILFLFFKNNKFECKRFPLLIVDSEIKRNHNSIYYLLFIK